MALVGVALGSNRGNRLGALWRARAALGRLGRVVAVSSVLETAPFGETEQPAFLNQVLLLHTELSPHELLRQVRRIERRLGRTPTYRWGPREIDIDLLFYDALRLSSPALTLPHPGLCEREFVLGPLREIAPEWARHWCADARPKA